MKTKEELQNEIIEKENEILKKKLDDIQQYIENKKVYGKSVNFSDADLIKSKLCSDSDRFPGNQKKEIKNGKLEMH